MNARHPQLHRPLWKPSAEEVPPLAIDVLAVLPFDERFQAYEDHGRAKAWFAEAAKDKRRNGWQWPLDYARAERAWAHYERALKKAQEGIAA